MRAGLEVEGDDRTELNRTPAPPRVDFAIERRARGGRPGTRGADRQTRCAGVRSDRQYANVNATLATTTPKPIQ